MRRLTWPVAALLAVALVGGACGSDTTDATGDGSSTTQKPPAGTVTLPDRDVDLAGTITKVTPFVPITENCIPAEDIPPDSSVSPDDPRFCTPEDNDLVGTILVEENVRPEQGRKISYTLTTATKIAGADGALATFDDLATGQTSDTWATGPCAESYPEQCTLEAVRITG